MPIYEELVHDLDDGPISVDGRVVGILAYKPTVRRVTLLVEISDVDDLHFSDTLVPEGIEVRSATEEELARAYQARAEEAENPTCAGFKSDDSPCTRDVAEPGDFCWQHEPDES